MLPQTSEWTFELLEKYDEAIAKVAEEYKLDTYPNQIEVISSEQMIDAYSSVGLPINYSHWSFGKEFLNTQKQYAAGKMGLAYEIVINSNPCIAYLMEENTMPMQALVIAHACYGHNSFFKGNYLFKTWTDADAIVDYMIFAKNYIAECERKYGMNQVAYVLDACHSIMNYGVSKYKRPPKLSLEKEKLRQKERQEYLQTQVNDLWRTIPKAEKAEATARDEWEVEPEENILYFIEKNAPFLESWKREIIRIVRKVAQYFYPQRQTKVMNEGWATFWHYTLLNTMYDKKLVGDGFMLEVLQSHTGVVGQVPYSSPYYSGINPYTLGFNMMTDIRRMCENPTKEDKEWFPDIAGSDWLETLDHAMRNFKDESFISQYLSPAVIRKMRLFKLVDKEQSNTYLIENIHDKEGYEDIRRTLSNQYNINEQDPHLEVVAVDMKDTRELYIRHTIKNNRPLEDKSTDKVLNYIETLWGYPVVLELARG